MPGGAGGFGRIQQTSHAFEHKLALKAADRLLKIAERRAKIMGIDAPERVEAAFRDLRESGIGPAAVSPLLLGIARGREAGGGMDSTCPG